LLPRIQKLKPEIPGLFLVKGAMWKFLDLHWLREVVPQPLNYQMADKYNIFSININYSAGPNSTICF
jgi:hypothetical protein